jgi:hypothetical protein
MIRVMLVIDLEMITTDMKALGLNTITVAAIIMVTEDIVVDIMAAI